MVDNPTKILKNMRTIVRNEALAHVDYYVTPTIVNRSLAKQGALCLGRQACAVGSLWLAAGVELTTNPHGDIALPGVDDQLDFMEDKPALRAAWSAMNTASREYADRNGLTSRAISSSFEGFMENLFESCGGGSPLIAASEFLPIIDRAMELLKPTTQANSITRIEYHDLTDGSMAVEITFKDGSTFTQTADVDYGDGSFSERDEYGYMTYPKPIA